MVTWSPLGIGVFLRQIQQIIESGDNSNETMKDHAHHMWSVDFTYYWMDNFPWIITFDNESGQNLKNEEQFNTCIIKSKRSYSITITFNKTKYCLLLTVVQSQFVNFFKFYFWNNLTQLSCPWSSTTKLDRLRTNNVNKTVFY